MNIAIIDDSRLAREELRRQVEQGTSHQVIGEAANADEAEHIIETHQPDLLLLDIQMPGRDGFELLEQLEPVPQVVFVTAYDEYAIKAFEVNALDYLTKPVDTDRLKQALAKAQERMKIKMEMDTSDEQDSEAEADLDRNILTEDDRVFVKDGEQCWFVRLGDIELFESEGNYTVLYFDEEKPLIKKSLNYLEKRLDSTLFFRANRSQMINVKKINSIDPWFNQTITVSLSNGRQVEISRRRSQEFRDKMSL